MGARGAGGFLLPSRPLVGTPREAPPPGVTQCKWRRLTIVGGVRDAWSVWRRGRLGTVCARGAHPAWSSGPSTSPLEVHIQDSNAAGKLDLFGRRRWNIQVARP